MTKAEHIFIFDMARDRSHLFFRFLSTHPDIATLWHPYMGPAIFGPERITQHTKRDNQDKTDGEWVSPTGTETYAEARQKHIDAVKHAKAKVRSLIPFLSL